jgi:hypothetical protein
MPPTTTHLLLWTGRGKSTKRRLQRLDIRLASLF